MPDLITTTASVIAMAQRAQGVTVPEVMEQCAVRERWAREILWRLRRAGFVTSRADESSHKERLGAPSLVFFWKRRGERW